MRETARRKCNLSWLAYAAKSRLIALPLVVRIGCTRRDASLNWSLGKGIYANVPAVRSHNQMLKVVAELRRLVVARVGGERSSCLPLPGWM